MNEYVLTSDLHLGCDACAVDKVLSFIHLIRAETLVVVGDFVHGDFLANENEWGVLAEFKHHCNLVLVRGNHDPATLRDLAFLMNARYYDDHFHFESGGKLFVAMHGHQWDKTSGVFGTYCGALATWLLAHGAPRLAGKLMQTRGAVVQNHAVEYAIKHGLHGIFCGHTHVVDVRPEAGYWNLGAWTNPKGTFATVNDGKVELVEV